MITLNITDTEAMTIINALSDKLRMLTELEQTEARSVGVLWLISDAKASVTALRTKLTAKVDALTCKPHVQTK